MSDATRTDEKRYWLDEPKNVNKVVYTLYTVCALLILTDLVYHKHPHFGFENLFGFYGFYGFLGSVGLVLTAKLLRRVLMRGEDYYESSDEPEVGGHA